MKSINFFFVIIFAFIGLTSHVQAANEPVYNCRVIERAAPYTELAAFGIRETTKDGVIPVENHVLFRDLHIGSSTSGLGHLDIYAEKRDGSGILAHLILGSEKNLLPNNVTLRIPTASIHIICGKKQ